MKKLLLSLLFLVSVAEAQVSNSTVTVQQPSAAKLNATVTGTVTVGSSALPTGASTSVLQTTGNASLASLDGKVVIADTGNVTVTSSTLPTGASTAALQTTGNASLSSIDGKIANGSGTAAGAIRVELPTNGTGVVGLNTGTNTVGSIASITTSVVPGTAATNLGKSEDTAHADGDVGVASWAVRQGPTVAGKVVFTGAIGRYSPQAVNNQGETMVVGPYNNGEVAVGAPVPVGGYAIVTTKAVQADTATVSSSYDATGRQITSPYCNPEVLISGVNTTDITDTTSTQIIAAQASKRVYVTGGCVSNTDLTVTTRVDILDGATVKATVMGKALDGQCFSFPAPLRGTSATAWNAQAGTTSAELRVTLVGCAWNN